MRKNYKLQITNYKQITIPKLQITNKAAPLGQVLNAFGEKDAHELHELTRFAERNYYGKIITKGGHGLHKESFKLQTMTAFNKSFCGGSRPRGAGCPRRPFGPSRELLNCSSQLFAQYLNLSYELRAKSQELTQRAPLVEGVECG